MKHKVKGQSGIAHNHGFCSGCHESEKRLAQLEVENERLLNVLSGDLPEGGWAQVLIERQHIIELKAENERLRGLAHEAMFYARSDWNEDKEKVFNTLESALKIGEDDD